MVHAGSRVLAAAPGNSVETIREVLVAGFAERDVHCAEVLVVPAEEGFVPIILHYLEKKYWLEMLELVRRSQLVFWVLNLAFACHVPEYH